MKKFIVILLALMLVVPSAFAAPRENKLHIIESSDLTGEILQNRNGDIIIEVIIGMVTSDEGDGEILNCHNPKYNYISYRDVEGACKGNIILSYVIYNPENNYVDDILYRFDYIVSK
jgi:hypothetical protein